MNRWWRDSKEFYITMEIGKRMFLPIRIWIWRFDFIPIGFETGGNFVYGTKKYHVTLMSFDFYWGKVDERIN